jgi:hypothetical protein
MAPPGALEALAVTDTQGITIPDPLSAPLKINEMYGRRKVPAKSQWGVAAPSTSDQFKLQNNDGKPMAKKWDRTSNWPSQEGSWRCFLLRKFVLMKSYRLSNSRDSSEKGQRSQSCGALLEYSRIDIARRRSSIQRVFPIRQHVDQGPERGPFFGGGDP